MVSFIRREEFSRLMLTNPSISVSVSRVLAAEVSTARMALVERSTHALPPLGVKVIGGPWVSSHVPRSSNIQIVPGLETQVMYVRGVGPRVAEMLAEKDILTAEDLLYHLPFRYEDRQNPRSLDELKPGEMASVIAEVRGAPLLRTRRMPIFEMTLGPGPPSR